MEREIGEIPPGHSSRNAYERGVCALERRGKELQVLFKCGEYRPEFRKLFWSDTRKGDPKTIAINPPHRGFVDPQRPIKAWNVESAFELCALLHLHVAFDFTTAYRNIQSAPLFFLSLTREGAAKLGGEPWLDPSVFWPGLRRSLFGTFRLNERPEFFH